MRRLHKKNLALELLSACRGALRLRCTENMPTANQEEDDARIMFEQQRDEWMSSMSSREQYEIDNAMDWVIAYGRDEG